MTLSLPQYDDIKAQVIAQIQSTLIVTVNGVRVQPSFVVGTLMYTLPEIIALVMDYFYGQLLVAHNSVRVASAVGSDLDAVFQIIGATRLPGSYATVPVKLWRYNPAGAPAVTIYVGDQFIADDQSGNPTLIFKTLQSAAQLPGVSGVIPANVASTWVMAQATQVGAAYNIAAGGIAQLATTIIGVDQIGNPAILTPAPPTVTPAAAGAVTWQYQLVAHGITGTTPPSGIGQTTTGVTPLSPTNKNTLTWGDVNDENGFDIIKNTGTVGAPVWKLLSTVPPGTTNFVDDGSLTPQPYTMPQANTTNTGQGGTDQEGDDYPNGGFRARGPQTIQAAAVSSALNVITALIRTPGVARAFINDTSNGQFNVSVVGTILPIPAATQTAIDNTIKAYKAAGAAYTWSAVTPTSVTVAYQYAVQAGIIASALIPSINAAIASYFSTLNVGDPVRWSGVSQAIYSVAGVQAVNSITMTPLGGSSYGPMIDVPGAAGVLYGPGTYTPSVGA